MRNSFLTQTLFSATDVVAEHRAGPGGCQRGLGVLQTPSGTGAGQQLRMALCYGGTELPGCLWRLRIYLIS